jgi:drug/metabolite transporter (DMT)-like permease
MSSSPSVAAQPIDRHRFDTLLAWYFVTVWGSGFLASKIGLQYAAPFTFLSLRFAFGIICLVPIIAWTRPSWPRSRREWLHLCVAGLLMHGMNLSGSHYAQYLGMSAGITALILATQPLFTAAISSMLMGERLIARQWLGVALGLAGVALVVWHKIDVRAVTLSSLVAVATGLIGITAGTLYQRKFCPASDLRSAAFVQFLAALIIFAPLGWFVEGLQVTWSWPLLGSVAFLVICASILAVSALHTLMRHGQATRVTSLLYLTPIIAVLLEWLMFSVVPTTLSVVGIAVTSAGVALVSWRR